MPNKPVIVLFVGIPGSGKTTFARLLAKKLGAVGLSSDSMRIAMWGSRKAIDLSHATPEERHFSNQLTFGALNYATNQIVASGNSVIYDSNANRRDERQVKHEIAATYGAQCVVVRIRVPYEVSLQRIQQRDDTHDSRRFSAEKAKHVLEQFTKDLEEPSHDEQVVEIDGEDLFDEQYESFVKQLDRIRKDAQ